MNKKTVAIINGPNLNILGLREPHYYGTETWEQVENKLLVLAESLKIKLVTFQSNHQGSIVDFIQENMEKLDGIVINPAGFTINGYPILDALTALGVPFMEVHLTNIFERGGWHSVSIFSENAVGIIAGMEGYSYELGLNAIAHYLDRVNP